MTNAPYLLPKARAGHAHGPRHGLRPHVPRRPRGRLRQGQADGRVRRAVRGQVPLHARGAGRIRAALALARARREQRRHRSAGRSRRSPCRAARATSSSTRTSSRRRRTPTRFPTLKPAFRKDGTVTAANSSSISDGAAALVLMRRSLAETQGPRAAGGDPRPRDARAGAGLVHDRAGRRDRKALREDRLDAEGRRSVRDQRGVRRGDDGGDEGARAAARTRSTSTAAPARSAIRSARRARASSSR